MDTLLLQYTPEPERHMRECAAFYRTLRSEGVPAEDARFVLPNAAETKILVTMNARELHQFFALRTGRCGDAKGVRREIGALGKEAPVAG